MWGNETKEMLCAIIIIIHRDIGFKGPPSLVSCIIQANKNNSRSPFAALLGDIPPKTLQCHDWLYGCRAGMWRWHEGRG